MSSNIYQLLMKKTGGPGFETLRITPYLKNWSENLRRKCCVEKNNAVVLSPNRNISEIDFLKLLNTRIFKHQSNQQHSKSPTVGLAKDIYEYFTLNAGPPYWEKVVNEPSTRQNDLVLRQEISEFLSEKTNEEKGIILTSLRDVGKQKRKNTKEMAERNAGSNVCQKCGLKKKSMRNRILHERRCRGRGKLDSAIAEQTRKSSRLKYKGGKGSAKQTKSIPPPSCRGLEVKVLQSKGHGLFTKRTYQKGDIICEYGGELLIGKDNINERKNFYNEKPEIPTYTYEFRHQMEYYAVDATTAFQYFGRYANHSRMLKKINAKMNVIGGKDGTLPSIALVAKRDILCCEEILHDYGDWSKGIIKENQWIKT